MAGYNQLVQVGRKKLIRLIQEVNKRRPGTLDQQEWVELDKKDRKARISQLSSKFAIEGFPDNELEEMEREVFKIIVPWKGIGITCLVVAVVGFLAYAIYKYTKFKDHARIYAIGNNVPVYEANDSTSKIDSRLDIWGESISSTKTSTAGALLFVADKGNMYAGEKLSFWNYLWNKHSEVYVLKDGVTINEKECDEYKHILQQLKGEELLGSLSTKQRRIIYSCFRTTNEYFNGQINSWPVKERNGYDPFAVGNDPSTEYLFLCLRSPSGKFYNLKITYNQSGYVGNEKIEFSRKIIESPLLFKAEPSEDKGGTTMIQFLDKNTGNSYKALYPPYDDLRELNDNSGSAQRIQEFKK